MNLPMGNHPVVENRPVKKEKLVAVKGQPTQMVDSKAEKMTIASHAMAARLWLRALVPVQ